MFDNLCQKSEVNKLSYEVRDRGNFLSHLYKIWCIWRLVSRLSQGRLNVIVALSATSTWTCSYSLRMECYREETTLHCSALYVGTMLPVSTTAYEPVRAAKASSRSVLQVKVSQPAATFLVNDCQLALLLFFFSDFKFYLFTCLLWLQ